MVILRLLLRFLPARIRLPFGAAILRAYEEQAARRLEEGPPRRAWMYFLATAFDLIRTGISERWQDLRNGWLHRHGLDGKLKGMDSMELGVWTDLKYAVRTLRRSPGFFAVAVTLLAVGIGANASIYTALRALLLTPPPFPEADRLVMADLTEAPISESGSALPRAMYWSYPKYRVFAEAPGRPVDRIAAFGARWTVLTGSEVPTRVRTELTSPDYFGVLGTAPALGRGFTPDDVDPDQPPLIAVISHGLWTRHFGGDPGVLGQTVRINGRGVEIVGVAAQGFQGITGGVDVWVPIASAEPLFNRFMVRGAQSHWLQVVGRLGADESIEQALAGMGLIGERIEEAYPGSDPTVARGASVRTLSSARENPTARTAVLTLGGAALLILLIACANLAGLLLARAPARTREVAVRKALGAGRVRLLRSLMFESLLIATAGGAAGLVLARFGIGAIADHWPARLAGSSMAAMQVIEPETLGLDQGVVMTGLALALLTTLVFGLAPALALVRRDSTRTLLGGQDLDPGARRSAGTWPGRSSLVTVEIALAFVLVVGAGLMIGSLRQLTSVEYGYDGDDVVSFSVTLPRGSAAAEEPLQFREALLREIGSMPGVESVALSCIMPLMGHCSITGVREVEGGPSFPEGSRPGLGIEPVSDDYFETLSIPLLSGRPLSTEDRFESERAIVLNESAAARLFPDSDPVGRTMRIGYFGEVDGLVRVVGVAGDVLYDPPQKGTMAEGYVSFRQDGSGERVLVRSGLDPSELLPLIRNRVHGLASDAVIHGETTAREVEARATADTRIVMALLTLFAVVAVVLAGAGIWGIVAYSVAGRRRELGLRMALGARSEEVVTLVLAQGARAALTGLMLGVPMALALSRLLSSLLFGLEPWDVSTHVLGAAVLTGVGLAASWLPARRVTGIDPMSALRQD